MGKSLFPTLDRSGKSTPDIDSLTKIRFLQVLFAKLLVRNRTDIENGMRLSEFYCGLTALRIIVADYDIERASMKNSNPTRKGK